MKKLIWLIMSIMLFTCVVRIFASSYDINSQHTYSSGYIPVLMYHNIEDKVENNSNTVQTDLFKEQLKALLDNDYTPITFNDLYDYKLGLAGLPKKPFIITFDDGYLNNYTIAYPILKELEVYATYFVSTNYVGVYTGNEHFTWEHAKEMEESGFINIQSHSATHSALSTLTKDEVINEIRISFESIEKNLGKRKVKVLAYPQFKNTHDTQNWIKNEGVYFQITNLAKKADLGDKRTNMKRIHVHNNMSPKELLQKIEELTIK